MKKLIVILAALSLILLMSFTVLAETSATADDPPQIPYVDFKPGSLLLGINDNMRISTEELQNPAAVFPNVDILSIRDLTNFSNMGLGIAPGRQILCVILAADSLNGMREAIEVFKLNPYVKYVSVNELVKTINNPNDPPEYTVSFSKDLDGVVLTVETEKAQYFHDEIISIKATVKNNTEETITIYSPHGGRIFFDESISKADQSNMCLINRETYGYGFPAVVIPLPIAPGEEYSQTLTYETWLGNITPAQPGIYLVKTTVLQDREPVEFEIEIMPQEPIVNVFSELITVDGAVLYQNSPCPAIVELYNSEQRLINYITTEDNAYTLTAPADSGYTLKVTKPGYLSYTVHNLTLTEGEIIKAIDLRQLAGDIDGDGVINATDLTLLLSEFNHKPVNYPNADIDDNGIVNATDLTYLLAGFNKHNVEVN